MAIDPKKYTRAELAKMVEDAQRSNGALEVQISGLCAQIDKKNDALSEYANEKEALKAGADALRTKLADAEETLGRTRSVVASMQGKIACANDEIVRLKENLGWSESRANWAASHPWSNLWAWIKRKLFW